MHDPATQVLRIEKLGLTIWHIDPERDGSDDSCDWFGRKRKLSPAEQRVEEALWDLETLLNNRPHYPDSREHKAFQPVSAAVRDLRRKTGWRLHPRWHVWHWSVSLDFSLNLKRWLFSRCSGCGRRFAFGYSPLSTSWNGDGPRWFRGEQHTYHFECAPRPRPVADVIAEANGGAR